MLTGLAWSAKDFPKFKWGVLEDEDYIYLALHRSLAKLRVVEVYSHTPKSQSMSSES